MHFKCSRWMAQVPDAFVIGQAFAMVVAFLAVSAQAGLSSMTQLKGAKHLLQDGFRQQQLLEMGGRQLLQLTDPWSSAPECPGKLVPPPVRTSTIATWQVHCC